MKNLFSLFFVLCLSFTLFAGEKEKEQTILLKKKPQTEKKEMKKKNGKQGRLFFKKKKSETELKSPSSSKPEEKKTPSTKKIIHKREKLPESEKKIEEKEKEAKKEKKPFVKGEIANVGSREIIHPYNAIGVRTGLTRINDIYYLSIDPNTDFNLWDGKLLMGYHLPFNIEIINTDITKNGEDSLFTLRSEDWDEWEDYLRVIKHFQYGRTEDQLFISMGSNFAYSVGHGTVMKRYVSNYDPSTTRIAGKFNYYNDYMGFETVVGDIPKFTTMGALLFVKPLSFFCKGYRCTSLSFGYTFAVDRKAPSKLGYVDYINYDNNDYFNGKNPFPPRIESDPDFANRPLVIDEGAVFVHGVDAEFKFYKDPYIDIKGFADYSWLQSTIKKEEICNRPDGKCQDPGGGFTFGLLGRFNIDEKRRHAIRTQVEYRLYEDSYVPSFFDTFYNVEQYEMLTNVFGQSNFRPDGRGKYARLLNEAEGDLVHSFLLEFNYSFLEKFSLSAGIESLKDSYNTFFHLELPDFYILKAMFSYYKRGMTSLGDTFDSTDVDTMMRGVLRIEVLPVLFINGHLGKQWVFWPEKKIREDDDLQGHFLAAWDWGLNIEIGYEY